VDWQVENQPECLHDDVRSSNKLHTQEFGDLEINNVKSCSPERAALSSYFGSSDKLLIHADNRGSSVK
jgi:hypothetical protein